MAKKPSDLPHLQRSRLRAQADMFATVSSHGTIVGTAREIALMEFFRAIVPRRFEILTGAIAATRDGSIEKASEQLDVLVVDTLDYPPLLRTGDLAVVLAQSVRVVVEAKSDLDRGQAFYGAMEQIGQARVTAGAGVFTALYCFGAPKKSSTLRDWLGDLVTWRRSLVLWASAHPKDRAATQPPCPNEYASKTKEDLLSVAAAFSAANLPTINRTREAPDMYAVQISDRNTFAAKAKKTGKPVFIVRTTTAVPVQQANAVLMHSAVTIDYALEFDDPSTGHTKWTFREVVLTDEQGQVLLSDSLWKKLMEPPATSIKVIHRSGSF